MPYTCIIIDDEYLDRLAVEAEVARFPEIRCIGSFDNSMDALHSINTAAPDIVFADIDMPGVNGLDLIRAINDQNSINIIISSHPEFALQGFELKVFDFILKPVESDRFEHCIKRLKEFMMLKEKAHSFDVMFENENIIFKEGYSTVKLKIREILYLEAFGDYTKIVTEKKVYLTLTTLSNFLESLPDGKFMRIHRSYVIAKDKVEGFNLKNINIGANLLPVGKTYIRETKQAFKNN